MRLKEDNTSWRSSGIVKRDTQHGGPIKERGAQSKKKNTWRWCRGKVDVDHIWKHQEPETGMFAKQGWRDTKVTMDVCERCGKQNSRTMLWNGKAWNEYWKVRNGESQT